MLSRGTSWKTRDGEGRGEGGREGEGSRGEGEEGKGKEEEGVEGGEGLRRGDKKDKTRLL